MSSIKQISFILALLFLAMSCGKAPTEAILFDFESDAELDLLQWNCHTLFTLSDRHATRGSRSLKMDLFPSEYPGLEFSPVQKDWSKYSSFSFDIYNPAAQPVKFRIRIDDQKRPPSFKDRYNDSFILNPGRNHISIPLSSLITSGTKRHLNLARIYTVYIFLPDPNTEQTFYIDAVRITNIDISGPSK